MRRTKQQYDVVIVLGNGLDEKWQLPTHVKTELSRAAQIFKEGIAPRIAVTGKWSINWDRLGITPPVTEASVMQGYLEAQGIQSKDILVEAQSKDTVGNAYFLKTEFFLPMGMKKLLVLCADFQEKRARFIFDKVFGEGYTISFLPTPTLLGKQPEVRASQQIVLKEKQMFLAPMKRGDHTFLTGRLYNDPHYIKRDLGTAEYIALGRRK